MGAQLHLPPFDLSWDPPNRKVRAAVMEAVQTKTDPSEFLSHTAASERLHQSRQVVVAVALVAQGVQHHQSQLVHLTNLVA